MENNSQKKLWFKAKQFGYGWTPCSIEGWLVIAGYVAFLVLAVVQFGGREKSPEFFFLIAASTAVLLAICIAKGEPAQWKWISASKPVRERNSWTVYLIFIIPLFLAGIGFCQLAYPRAADFSAEKSAAVSLPTLFINNETIHLEVAGTPALRQLGLSGHAPLAPDQGMIFIFPQPAHDGFWMKDMLFSLDMIWLDANYKVITIKKNATPESFPAVFYPSAPASFVLELPAGFADAHKISVGSTLVIR